MINLTIIGSPVPQGRPRFGNGRAYDPPKSRAWKKEVAVQAKQQYKREMLEGPLKVEMTFWLKKPKSKPNRMFPAVKPDIDNLYKAIADALEKIVYEGDQQIVEITVKKWYVAEFHRPTKDIFTPGVDVKIEELISKEA